MTKAREPLSLEKALVRIADVLPGGFDDMAEVTRRKAWQIRAWADPDKRDEIPVRDARLLDKACKAAGGGMPILEHYAAQLGADDALRRQPESGRGHAAAVVRECAEAVAALIDGREADVRREVGQAIEALYRALIAALGPDAFDTILDPTTEARERGPPHPH